ncbi:MAG: sugar phosphate isomerase/epimerase [Kiritimatiellaeota bacterium]|nr:sugar phosphate isomerase/epimerase [Kiritimatiellota bacterium]
MIRTVVSVTFRPLGAIEVMDAAVEAGLEGVEWGGDIHAPAGEIAVAEGIRRECARRSLACAAYGSYYRAGEATEGFAAVLGSAVALGVPLIRVWAGCAGSAETTPASRRRVADDLRRIGDCAGERGIAIGLEYHSGTLTDTVASAEALLFDEADHSNVFTYWQPPVGASVEANVDSLRRLWQKIIALHVFAWKCDEGRTQRLNLAEHADEWRQYAAAVKGRPLVHAGLEFVKNDDLAEFRKDAATLKDVFALG